MQSHLLLRPTGENCQSGAWGAASDSGGQYILAIAARSVYSYINVTDGGTKPGIFNDTLNNFDQRYCSTSNPLIGRCGCQNGYKKFLAGEFETSESSGGGDNKTDNILKFTSISCVKP